MEEHTPDKCQPKLLVMLAEKAISRKLVAFIVGTLLFVTNFGLTSDDWLLLAMVYMSSQGAVDIVNIFKGKKS